MADNEPRHWALITRYQAQLSHARANGDAAGEHMALLGLGASYFSLQQWHEAREHLALALGWLRSRGEWIQDVQSRALLGYACLYDNQAELALEQFALLGQLAQAHGLPSLHAESLLGRSVVLDTMGRFEDALQACREALPLLTSPVDTDTRRQVLFELGFVLSHLDRNQEAIVSLEEALALAREQGETDYEARILAYLGVSLLDITGRDQQGIDRLGEALALFRDLGDQHEQAKTLADLGTAHLQHRSTRTRGLQQGLVYLAEAEALARTVEDRELLSSILETQGRLNERLGKQPEALSAFRRASTLDPHSHPVERLRSIGRVYQQMGEQDAALEYDMHALLKAFALGDINAEIEQLIHISDDHVQRASFEQACSYLEKALLLALAGDDDALTGGLHIRLAHLLYYRKDKQSVQALAVWRIGTLYAQAGGDTARFRTNLDAFIHPVRELTAVLGKRAFLTLWSLSEPIYQSMIAEERYDRTLSRVVAKLGASDPFSFLEVEPLIAALYKIDAQQLHGWLREAVQLHQPPSPTEPWVAAFEHFFAGMAEEERFDREAAYEHFEAACGLAPSFAEAFMRRGMLLAEEESRADSLSDLDRALELAPDSWQASYARGHAYSLFREYGPAIADYTQALRLNPSAGECRYERAVAYLESGEAKRAMLDGARLTSEYPFHQDSWLIYGRARLAMGEHDQAVYVFTDMIDLRGFAERGDIYYYRGLAYLWLGDARKAKADFTRSWRADNEQVKSKIMLIWLSWGEKKPTRRTSSRWNEIIEMNFFDWHASLLSQLLGLVDFPHEGLLEEFDLLMGLEPERFEAPFWKGVACASLGQIDAAVRLWEQALQLHMPPTLLSPLRWFEQEQPSTWEQVKAFLKRSPLLSSSEPGSA